MAKRIFWADKIFAGQDYLRDHLQESHIEAFAKTLFCQCEINLIFSDGSIRCKDCNKPEHSPRPKEPDRMWYYNRAVFLRNLAKIIGGEILMKKMMIEEQEKDAEETPLSIFDKEYEDIKQ